MGYADAIREARDRCGYTQQQAATRAGITVQHWGQVERGKEPGSDVTVAKMAHAVAVTAEQLESDGRDSAADRLRELQADEPHETIGDGRKDDALMLQTILLKLTPGELRWLIAHADMFDRLKTHSETQETETDHNAPRRAG